MTVVNYHFQTKQNFRLVVKKSNCAKIFDDDPIIYHLPNSSHYLHHSFARVFFLQKFHQYEVRSCLEKSILKLLDRLRPQLKENVSEKT